MPEITNRHFKHLIYWQQNVLLLLTSHYSYFKRVNLNISRYVTTATAEEPIDLIEVSKELTKIEDDIQKAKAKYNQFLKELELPEMK